MKGIDASVELVNYHKRYDKVKNKLVEPKINEKINTKIKIPVKLLVLKAVRQDLGLLILKTFS